MTKYLVSGYIGFDNFGDEAIACLLAKHLKSLNAEKITWISSNPKKTSALYNVNSVGMLNFMDALNECDILISGGGSLLQDITSLKSLVYYILILILALLKDKKVFIFAQGFTPFRTKLGEFMTRFVLKRCHYISVRDKASQGLLDSWGISSELIPDPVFGIEVQPHSHKGIGVQLRDFPTLTDCFLEDLSNNIANSFPNETIKLISLQDNIDLPVLRNFQNMLEQKDVRCEIIKNLTLEKAVEEISNLEYLIGMRFHSCLIASKTGVKTIGINYDKKVEKLSQDIGFNYINLNEPIEKTLKQLFINPENYKIPQTYFPNFK